MSEADVRTIALFFYYSLLDDQVAVRATERALKKLSAQALGAEVKDAKSPRVGVERSLLVNVCTKLWHKYEGFTVRGGSGATPATHWRLPETLDLAPWRQFQREGLREDMLAVVWVKILGCAESDVAKGLGLSPGTIRYRVARGVRQLGQTNRLGKYVGV